MSYDCYCDYDEPDFYARSVRKARKHHKCEECSGTVAPGEKYEHVAGCWDGYVSTMKTCERCYDIRTWVKNNVPCFCWAHGSMIDDAREAVEEAASRAPEETVGLRFGFRRRVAQLTRYNLLRVAS